MFYQITEQFDYIRDLERQWQSINNELALLDEHRFKCYEHSKDKGWDILMLYVMGETREEYLTLCPITMSLLRKIPGITLALVSRLSAHSRIHPHTDKGVWLEKQKRYITYNDDNLIRCHLGLAVPKRNNQLDCAIKIGHETAEWETGKCMMFDCNVMHEAWNATDEDRVVLIVDFVKPGAEFGNSADIELFRSHLVSEYMC